MSRMPGGTLFDPGIAENIEAPTLGRFHEGAGDTEVAAAVLVYPKSGKKRARCLDAFVRAGARGLTDSELAEKTGFLLYTAAPRRGELKTMGWVEDSGHRRPTPAGATAIVWRLTQAALKRLAHDQR